MNALIACEFSGVIRDTFIDEGYNAISCDLKDGEGKYVANHYKGDVRDILPEKWDIIIAHPECTYLCNSGVHHLYKGKNRWKSMYDAATFFNLFLDHPCERICVENPIPHKYALQLLSKQKKYDQIIQPWMFGHKEKKATCLWLKGLPKLKQTCNVREETELLPKKEQQRIHYMTPSVSRSAERSKTYDGIAKAMVQQWVKEFI